MRVSERTLKWVLCLYPPFLFQRIWVCRFHRGFVGVEVKINKSLFNSNSNGTIFGGTIFSAADPFYALMFEQIFRRKGYKTKVWLKSGRIQFLKPGRSSLYFRILITPEDIEEAESALKTNGKFIKTFSISIMDKDKVIAAITENEVYIRDVRYQAEKASIGQD